MQNIHDIIGEAGVSKRSPFIEEGTCPVVWIESVKIEDTRKGSMFFVELDVFEGSENNPTGTSPAMRVKLSIDAGPGNARGAVAEIMGVDPEEVNGDILREVCGEENPLRGTLCKMKSYNIEKRDGNPFTLTNFERLSDTWQDQAKELREQAGFN